MSDQKFIIVSNRLPVSVTKEDGKLTFKPSSGGLATAMSSLDIQGEQIWIGWPGISSDELTTSDKATITRKLRAYNCVPVFLTAAQVKNFYEGYANDTLWPLFHYFETYAQYNDAYWEAYKTVNHLFNKAVIKHADEQFPVVRAAANPTAAVHIDRGGAAVTHRRRQGSCRGGACR